MENIKSFLRSNENLINIDLSNTGIDAESIIDLVSFIKSANDKQDDEPQLLRNLASILLSPPDEYQGLTQIFSDINQILSPDLLREQDIPKQSDFPTMDVDVVDDEDRGEQKSLVALKEPFSAQNQNLKQYKNPMEGDSYENQRMIVLQRLYNHEEEFSANGDLIKTHQWQAFYGPPKKTCWVTSQAHYTLFFH